MPIKDKEKRKAYSRQYYRETYSAKQKAYIKARHTRIRKAYADWKATLSCVMCGEDDSICLEFHHVDPATKDVHPADLVKKGWSLERIQRVLTETCLCVCANCHRKAHRDIKLLHVKKLAEKRSRTTKKCKGKP